MDKQSWKMSTWCFYSTTLMEPTSFRKQTLETRGLTFFLFLFQTDLLKMDVNGIGHPLLYFGIAENPSEPRRQSKSAELDPIRPTSYLPPLQQCQSSWQDLNSVNDASNELGPIIPHARVSGDARSSSSLPTVTFACIYWIFGLAHAIYRRQF